MHAGRANARRWELVAETTVLVSRTIYCVIAQAWTQVHLLALVEPEYVQARAMCAGMDDTRYSDSLERLGNCARRNAI
ncbi:hypothetical protein CFBP7900_18340 [Xanthomonas hortorum pv. carotae]|uniref:Uncharacterized protein n=1 Tax=Xanthomonas hortorum pv. carotae TaxID=487904 RepID=A0A6V7D7E1_9XANT|nr:hypothetical protein CFBP7900_18340 [Xanthomonas hortorum pv. carotae]CAD0329340.1 hypothetical protein CFBP7900_18340 [Xanthomonas hortorum pv. carotae]